MLSIIICSRSKVLSESFIDNIRNTVGLEHEIIAIDNSDNQNTIFTAYNKGFELSSFPIVCFIHDDVLFHTDNWGQKIIKHLEQPKCGIIGFAGGSLVSRIPASWSSFFTAISIIQSDRTGRKPSRVIIRPDNFDQERQPVVLLDGVFLGMKRELMEKIKFDETISGFHSYDLDISLQSIIAGYTNFVIYDIGLEHFSRGNRDATYYRNMITVFKKWEAYLPLKGLSLTKFEIDDIPGIELSALNRFTKELIRKGFSTKEIIEETLYYSNKIQVRTTIFRIKLKIVFIRLISCPKYLMR